MVLKGKDIIRGYNGLYDLTLIMNYLRRIIPYAIAISMDNCNFDLCNTSTVARVQPQVFSGITPRLIIMKY